MRRPDAILTADWHLREDQPTCRTDDFLAAQWEKVDFVAQLQRKYSCPVLHAGDLYHSWKPSPYLLSQTIERLPENFITIYGNHDLPRHNYDLRHKSGVHTLMLAGVVEVLSGGHWGWEEPGVVAIAGGRIALWHVMTWKGNRPWPGCADPSAREILRRYSDYDLIVTGHNHVPFVERERQNGRLLVNPGGITRQTADQSHHKPSVYLWYADKNEVRPVPLPTREGVVSREHIERAERRDARIEAFIERLRTEWEADVSFERNLERFGKENDVPEEIMDLIKKAMEE